MQRSSNFIVLTLITLSSSVIGYHVFDTDNDGQDEWATTQPSGSSGGHGSFWYSHGHSSSSFGHFGTSRGGFGGHGGGHGG